MATGIIASLSGAASVTYTPNSDAKLLLHSVHSAGYATVTVNGAIVIGSGFQSSGTGNVVTDMTIYVGANQSITVALAPNTGSVSCILSALES